MTKILAVDDQPDNLDLLLEILEENNFEVILAKNGKEALVQAEAERPDVILLDIHMPEMDGYQTCDELKKRDITKDIPVIFLTANTSEESLVKGLDLGAYDYVTKPFNEKELLARINVMVRIRETEQKKTQMAVTDQLTGLYNRRHLEKRFKEEVSRAKRDGLPISCILMDIDYFKSINDTYGHDAGDFVLKELGGALKQNFREYDTVVRYGGEEFVVLLPSSRADDAVKKARELRKAIEEKDFVYSEQKIIVTLSIGVYGCEKDNCEDNLEDFIKAADGALYAAKKSGRNRVAQNIINKQLRSQRIDIDEGPKRVPPEPPSES